jgi:broad specificity phosphatase PhoE
VITPLQRTRQTAQAILDHMADVPEPLVEPLLAEQHFGDWQGLSHAELAERRDGAWHRFWLAPAAEAPPGGESFVQVVERVCGSIRRLSAEHAGRDIVAVAHGGTIRAALALALELDPERALALSVDNCSLTRLDHIAGPASSDAPANGQDEAWRVVRVNQPPYIEDGTR